MELVFFKQERNRTFAVTIEGMAEKSICFDDGYNSNSEEVKEMQLTI